jgi:Tfp pilus assembly protein PilX
MFMTPTGWLSRLRRPKERELILILIYLMCAKQSLIFSRPARAARLSGGKLRQRRAFAAVLAMLYLMLFTVLAVGFYAGAAISLQIAGNDQAANDAQAAAESGLQFVKYQLGRIEIRPPADSATAGDEFAAIVEQLANHLDGSANMNGHAVESIENVIYLPASNDFISLDSSTHSRFQAQIAARGPTLSVKVTGYGRIPTIGRAIRMDFERKASANASVKFVAAPQTYEEVLP